MTVSAIQSAPSLLAYRANSLQSQPAASSSSVAAPDRETPAENSGVDSDDHSSSSRGATFSTYA